MKMQDFSPYKRVLIIGSSGSGKTSLGRLLSQSWGMPFFDLDDVAWLPNWILQDPQKEKAAVEQAVENEKWIIVGNYSRHKPLIWPKAELIIWLDLSLLICLKRALFRALNNLYHHKSFCNGNFESISRLCSLSDRSIIYWILKNYKRKKKRYELWLEKDKDSNLCPHIRIKTPKELQDFLGEFS